MSAHGLLTIRNADGRAFNVRAVFAGDRYGLDDCLTHTGAPMIEFYDAEQSAEAFGPRGQFVSRYYAFTLANHAPTVGLCLAGRIPEWSVTGANVRAAVHHVLLVTTQRVTA